MYVLKSYFSSSCKYIHDVACQLTWLHDTLLCVLIGNTFNASTKNNRTGIQRIKNETDSILRLKKTAEHAGIQRIKSDVHKSLIVLLDREEKKRGLVTRT